MRWLWTVAGLAVLAIANQGCGSGRDWVCRCDVTIKQDFGGGTYVDVYPLQNQSEKDATALCTRIEDEINRLDYVEKVACDLLEIK